MASASKPDLCPQITSAATLASCTPEFDSFDKVLVSIGRTPNGKLIDCEKAGVNVDDWGFIKVDKQMKTNVTNIYAIGDIVGQPMMSSPALVPQMPMPKSRCVCLSNKAFDTPSLLPILRLLPEAAQGNLPTSY
jgi:dihydrolipoamide dehydrogenase